MQVKLIQPKMIKRPMDTNALSNIAFKFERGDFIPKPQAGDRIFVPLSIQDFVASLIPSLSLNSKA